MLQAFLSCTSGDLAFFGEKKNEGKRNVTQFY
ncbi:hypothetical protein SGO_0024 [Streptococcus gordonii str. Challis substr. CH1]|uniref:Uncharacterized protein n=1 Tax=Streptococcus gordonii (strain Challis / ATCC 35105 / BCRC 15272 / CH1 / DL1 / V288) TaxID=467705 RepID=A8AU86_STRGC|nr:hypothetical protein SGO_0024 [Streptococcus gordonii str. Challis substr. CH1]